MTIANYLKPYFKLYVWLILMSVSLTGCSDEITKIKENLTMPDYASAEFTWGMDITSYGLPSEKINISLEAFPYANRMSDATGKDVARVLFSSGAEWGRPGGVLGSQTTDGETTRLPKTLHLRYFDLQDRRVYELANAELPIEHIYKLFKAGFVDDSGNKTTYQKIMVGLAPRGYIVVWVASSKGRVHEVAHYQAQAITPSAEILEEYRHYRGGDPLESLSSDSELWSAELTAKIKAGTEPNPEPYIRKRIKYPWNATVTGIDAREFEYWRWTINEEKDMVRLRTMATERQQVKALPRQMEFFFNLPDVKRYIFRVNLYTQERVWVEPDLSELKNIFEQLYPNRRPDMGEESFPESEFANFEFQISADLKEMRVFVVKGDQRIELKYFEVKSKRLQAKTYNTLPNYKPTKEQLENLRLADAVIVRPHERCPKTGFWKCINSNIPYEMSFIKGDKIPFPHGTSSDIDPTSIYWEWMRDLRPDETIG